MICVVSGVVGGANDLSESGANLCLPAVYVCGRNADETGCANVRYGDTDIGGAVADDNRSDAVVDGGVADDGNAADFSGIDEAVSGCYADADGVDASVFSETARVSASVAGGDHDCVHDDISVCDGDSGVGDDEAVGRKADFDVDGNYAG